MANEPTTHTPGPWTASCLDGTLKVRGPSTAKKYKQREICRCYGVNRLDVDLICAAPDLLAAARDALEDLAEAAEVETSTMALLRAAIAKAEGKP